MICNLIKMTGFGLIILNLICLIPMTTAEGLHISCSNEADCDRFHSNLTGAQCYDGQCICSKLINNERIDCRPEMSQEMRNIIGGPCPCTAEDSECDEKTKRCYCRDDFIPNKDRQRCMPVSVTLNGNCETDRQCQIKEAFAECHHSQRKCLCKIGYEHHGSNCLALLEKSCANDNDCSSYGSALCVRRWEKCACLPGHVRDQNSTRCIQGAIYGAACSTSAECQLKLGAPGVCRDRLCSCRPKFYASEKTDESQSHKKSIVCLPRIAYGSYCRTNEDCQEKPLEKILKPSMVCTLGDCLCADNHETLDIEACIPISAGNKLIFPLAVLVYGLIFIFVTNRIFLV